MGGVATVVGRGRKPKPTALKRLQGNAGKRKLKDIPQFGELQNVEPPEWLTPLAVKMWQTVMPELLSIKVLTIADIHNVEAFCMAYARWREAEDILTERGLVIETPMGSLIKNPAATIVAEAKKQMVQFGSLLGLDPSSRERLTGSAQQEAVANPFADL